MSGVILKLCVVHGEFGIQTRINRGQVQHNLNSISQNEKLCSSFAVRIWHKKLRSSHDCFFYFVLRFILVRLRHPITLLRYADKCIVNIMKVHTEMNNLQL